MNLQNVGSTLSFNTFSTLSTLSFFVFTALDSFHCLYIYLWGQQYSSKNFRHFRHWTTKPVEKTFHQYQFLDFSLLFFVALLLTEEAFPSPPLLQCCILNQLQHCTIHIWFYNIEKGGKGGCQTLRIFLLRKQSIFDVKS